MSGADHKDQREGLAAVSASAARPIGVAATVTVGGLSPQHFVNEDTVGLHSPHCLGNAARSCHHNFHRGGFMMDVLAVNLIAERSIVACVHEEGMPANVHRFGRAKGATRGNGDQLEKAKCLDP